MLRAYPDTPKAKKAEGHAGELVVFVALIVQHRFLVDLCQLLTHNLFWAARGEGLHWCGYPLVVVLLAHKDGLQPETVADGFFKQWKCSRYKLNAADNQKTM